jgi:hypothetical protein
MNGTNLKKTQKRLYDELLSLLRRWKAAGRTDLLEQHQERLRKMGWTFKV